MKKVYDAATELYNKQFEKLYDKYEKLLDAKKGEKIEILTLSKLLTRLPVLLAQIKTKKNEITQILHLVYQHNKITKTLYNNLIKSL